MIAYVVGGNNYRQHLPAVAFWVDLMNPTQLQTSALDTEVDLRYGRAPEIPIPPRCHCRHALFLIIPILNILHYYFILYYFILLYLPLPCPTQADARYSTYPRPTAHPPSKLSPPLNSRRSVIRKAIAKAFCAIPTLT